MYVELCSNEIPYNHPFENNVLHGLTTSGIYYDTLVSKVSSCDSIIELHLQIWPTDSSSQYDTICDNGVYDFHGHIISGLPASATPYEYDTVLKTCHGCDSTVHLYLTVHPTYNDPIIYDTICESSLPYYYFDERAENFQGLTRTGVYADTIPSIFGCDSILTLMLQVLPTTIHEYDKVWCASAGPFYYGDKGKIATSTGIYIDTLITKNQYGCDSIEIVHLEWRDSIYFHDTIQICDNKVFEKHNKLYIGDKFSGFGGVYDPTLYDSTRIYPVGLHYDTITFLNSIGCDSSYFITIEVQKTHYSIQERNVCQYEDVIYEAMYNGIGGKVNTNLLGDFVFIDTIQAIGNGCDSIINMTYHIRPHYHFSQGEVVLCQAIDSLWVWYNDNGDPQDTISLSEGNKTYTLGTSYNTIYGCDSTYGISVYVAPTYHMYDTIVLCENDSVHWQGMLFTGSQYVAYGKTYDASNFDSIKTSLMADEYDYSIRRGTKMYDCDSIHYLHLIVNPVKRVNITRRYCQSTEPYFYENMNRGIGGYLTATHLSDSIIRNDTISTINGCDSIITLRFYVDSVYRYGTKFTFCQDTINCMREWVDEEGISHGWVLDISKPGNFKKTEEHQTIYGCDSIYGVEWEVYPIYRFDSIYTICQNERIDWQGKGFSGSHYGWNNELLPTINFDEHRDSVYYKYVTGDEILLPGIYYDTINYYTIFGCDSTYYLQLNVKAANNIIQDVSICESDSIYILETNDKYGVYRDTIFIEPITRMIDSVQKDTAFYIYERQLKSVDDCDSIIHLHLTVYPTYEFFTKANICWDEYYEWQGRYLNRSGVYYDSLRTHQGCDSVYVLELYVKPVLTIPKYIDACDNEIVTHSDTLWYGDDSLQFSISNTMLWKPGMEIPKPHEYRDVIYKSFDGCDTIIYRYYLNIHPHYYYNTSVVLCSNERYQLHDHLEVSMDTMYSTNKMVPSMDTIFIDTLSTIYGCDSIYTCHARIHPVYKYITHDTICENDYIRWRNHTYMKGNGKDCFISHGDTTYHDVYKTINGCDSIYELQLHINPIYTFETFDTICENEWYQFRDTIINTPGFYYDSLLSITGCDSVYHLYLVVNDTTFEIRNDTICFNETYYLHDVPITKPGFYKDTTLNDWNCHHYTYLYLSMIEPTVATVYADSICADAKAFEIFFSYSGTEPIEYSLYFNEFGHSQGFEDRIHWPIPMDSAIYYEMPFKNNDTTQYPRPDHYPIKLVLHNGICLNDSMYPSETDIIMNYPSWVTEQRFRDVIAILSTKYNGGYEFETFQWYRNGQKLLGETHEYLYLPHEMEVSDTVSYYVRVTRPGEVESFQTCPIWIYPDQVDTLSPNLPYISVVPTYVVREHPVVNILSINSGRYEIYNCSGWLIEKGEYIPDQHHAMEITLPSIDGVYCFKLYDNEPRPDDLSTVYERERVIKVIVGP